MKFLTESELEHIYVNTAKSWNHIEPLNHSEKNFCKHTMQKAVEYSEKKHCIEFAKWIAEKIFIKELSIDSGVFYIEIEGDKNSVSEEELFKMYAQRNVFS